MSDKPKVYIAATGMVTPAGANTEMTATMVNAGISLYQEVDYYDSDYNKIRMATTPDELLDDSLDEQAIINKLPARHTRMLQLARFALLQIVGDIPDTQQIPLFLATAENISENIPSLKKPFIANLAKQCGIEIDMVNSRILYTGRAGGLDAIDLAIRFLQTGISDYAIVGGVDSYYDKDVISYYLEQERLLSASMYNGFVPGEAAAFLLLKLNYQPHDNAESLPYIIEPGTGNEEGHMSSNKTYTGDGLAHAVTNALNGTNITNIKTIHSSMNGEIFFAKELGVSIMRNSQAFSDNYKVNHPADCFGDLGAAIGPVLVGMSSYYLQQGKEQSPSLVYCSSDSASRSAAVISI